MKLKQFLSHGLVLLLCLLLLFILITITNTTNANAGGGTDESVKKMNEPTDLQLDHSGDDQASSNILMGVDEEEHCSAGDEECLKRRVISEAHLDYIYTQHQKP